MGWIKYLFHWDRRPRIPSHLVTPFDMTTVSPDELMVFKAGKARDVHYVAKLMERYEAKNAVELLQRLPRAKRPSVRERIRALIMRAEGSLPYDPIKREVRAIRAEQNTPVHGIRHTRLKGINRRG